MTTAEPPGKLPERADAINVPLDFGAAIKAAPETRPPPPSEQEKKPKPAS